MPVQIMARTVAEARCQTEDSLEGLLEREATLLDKPRDGSALALLSAARIQCQKGGPLLDGRACLRCERFVNFVPTEDGRRVRIRCAYLGNDPVKTVMTLAEALVTIPTDTPCRLAEAIGVEAGIRHLLVVARGCLVGIVSLRDLRDAWPEEPVAARMKRRIWVVEPQTTLAEAAALMESQRIGCLPVMSGGAVVGVVTRGDLRRVGMM